MYDTPFRSYDPQIGRFHQIDPLADKAPGINPYRFGFNNSIGLNDPSGLYEGNFADYIMDLFNRLPDNSISFFSGDALDDLMNDFNTDGDFDYLKDVTGGGINSEDGFISALSGYGKIKENNPGILYLTESMV